MVLLCVLIIALQLFLESNTGLFSSTVMDVSAEQPMKHLCPILVTDDGMSMVVSAEQSKKHHFPKLFTEDGMLIDVSAEQPKKQERPKLVTEEGILIDESE